MPFDEQNSESSIFTCKKCGDCCKGYGGTCVTRQDIEQIADFTGIAPDHLLSDYCVMSGLKPVLAQKPDGHCIFWDQICTIHPVKPRMCRAWPFIESVLTDTENWRIMAGFCPGMRPDAPDDVIRSCVTAALARSDKNSNSIQY